MVSFDCQDYHKKSNKHINIKISANITAFLHTYLKYACAQTVHVNYSNIKKERTVQQKKRKKKERRKAQGRLLRAV